MAKKKAPDPSLLDRGVRWTDEQRREVWSWRGAVNPEFEREDLEQMRDPRGRFKDRVRQIGYDFPRTKKWFKKGLERVEPSVRPMMEAALEAAAQKKEAPGPLEIETEVALVALDIIAVFYSFEYWVSKEGLPFALRALARCHEYWTSGDEYGYTDEEGVWLMHDRTRSGSLPEYAGAAWKQLRAALAVTDDATYTETKKLAAELRAGAPPVVRALIAIAFATERDWANEAADETLAEQDPSGWAKALVTVADVSRGVRLARNKEWCIEEDEMLTLMAREGSAAAPVIVAALETAGNNEWRKTYAKLLSMIETEQVAVAFAKWISNKTVNPIATKYYKRLPELARAALGPIAKGKGIEARGAAVVLASLR